MSNASSDDEKTEDATDKKLNDALERGNVPVSQEAILAAAVMAILFSIIFFLPRDASSAQASLMMFLEDPSGWRLNAGPDALALGVISAAILAAAVIPTIALFAFFGLAAAVVQSPPAFVLSRITPDAARVSMRKGAKRLFGSRGWTQFGKAFLKIFIISATAIIGFYAGGRSAQYSMTESAELLPRRMLEQAASLTWSTFLSILALAAADLTWTRIHWRRDQKMTRQEVKDELRQSEGDPMLKARIRSLRMMRTRKRMLTSVPTATLVIVNPTHFAVALRYARNKDPAPVVVAKGMDLTALKIRKTAEDNNVPVVENKPLAQSLFKAVVVDDCIPVEFYRAIAELIHFLDQKRAMSASSSVKDAG